MHKPPPYTRAHLLATLDKADIAHQTVDHKAVFTVEEGREIKTTMPGGHSKNLFLKDKAGTFYLVVAHADTRVDLVGLGKSVGAKGRFSFGKAEIMEEILGVSPGSVTPFALINDVEKRISAVFLDKTLMAFDPVWFHPLENTASTAISPASLLLLLASWGYDPQIMDLANPAPESAL